MEQCFREEKVANIDGGISFRKKMSISSFGVAKRKKSLENMCNLGQGEYDGETQILYSFFSPKKQGRQGLLTKVRKKMRRVDGWRKWKVWKMYG